MGRPKRSIRAVAEASVAPPDSLPANQTLALVVRPEGNSLFAVELPDKTALLAEMPDRFRNTIWIRRGGYVVIEMRPANLDEDGQQQQQHAGRGIGAEIVNIVLDEKDWRRQPYWPKEFAKKPHDQDGLDEDSGAVAYPDSDGSSSQ